MRLETIKRMIHFDFTLTPSPQDALGSEERTLYKEYFGASFLFILHTVAFLALNLLSKPTFITQPSGMIYIMTFMFTFSNYDVIHFYFTKWQLIFDICMKSVGPCYKRKKVGAGGGP